MVNKKNINSNIIRKMSEDDLTECTEIFVEAYRTLYSEPWSQDSGKSRIKEVFHDNKDFCFVADEHKELRGFIIARKDTWYDGCRIWIEELVVKKKYRG